MVDKRCCILNKVQPLRLKTSYTVKSRGCQWDERYGGSTIIGFFYSQQTYIAHAKYFINTLKWIHNQGCCFNLSGRGIQEKHTSNLSVPCCFNLSGRIQKHTSNLSVPQYTASLSPRSHNWKLHCPNPLYSSCSQLNDIWTNRFFQHKLLWICLFQNHPHQARQTHFEALSSQNPVPYVCNAQPTTSLYQKRIERSRVSSWLMFHIHILLWSTIRIHIPILHLPEYSLLKAVVHSLL